MSSFEYRYLSPWKVIDNSEEMGVGISKATIFKGRFGAELEIQEPGVWTFSETIQLSPRNY